jgi:hypothetical protein
VTRRYRSATHPQDLEPLNWQDPDAVRDWLRAVRHCVHQIVTVARDNRHPRRFRILPPLASRATLADATRGLRYLLRASTLGLPREPKDGAA